MHDEYRHCLLCPRACGADRASGKHGFCGVDAGIRIARAALHFWEEPCLSGSRGSGAVFFSGCGLRCSFCQNREIALARHGAEITEKRLSDIFLGLAEKGAENLNLVTATQYAPSVRSALATARESGLSLPVVWNSGGYETVETLGTLRGAVDIFLPDFKYSTPKLAEAYANAPDYPRRAAAALAEMVAQTGKPVFDSRGMLLRGTIVRILLLPGSLLDAKLTLRRLFDRYGNAILYSLMSQYTPMPGMRPPLDRRVTEAEYRSLVSYAESLGVEYGYVQEGESAKESFIPPFDLTGVQESPVER